MPILASKKLARSGALPGSALALAFWAAPLVLVGCSSSDDDAGTGGASTGGEAGTGGASAGTGGAGTGGDATGGLVAPVDPAPLPDVDCGAPATPSCADGGGGGGGPGEDDIARSLCPPGGLHPTQIPQFVTIGFDDNGVSGIEPRRPVGGMRWALDWSAARTNPDGSPVRLTFYFTSKYIAEEVYSHPAWVKEVWVEAIEAGHEIGLHTHTHEDGSAFGEAEWGEELDTNIDWLTRPRDPSDTEDTPNDEAGVGADRDQLFGFRTPFLAYSDALFAELTERGVLYDCSIEDGLGATFSGNNQPFPYTLDDGTPAAASIGQHPGLWEVPVQVVIVPPDDACEAYGVEPGLRQRIASRVPSELFDQRTGVVVGFDYNMWAAAESNGMEMNADEFVATLEYTLDLHLEGNRAPFFFGAHTDYYSSEASDYLYPNSTFEERQAAIEEFVDYALSKDDVRVVSAKTIIDWMRAPRALECE